MTAVAAARSLALTLFFVGIATLILSTFTNPASSSDAESSALGVEFVKQHTNTEISVDTAEEHEVDQDHADERQLPLEAQEENERMRNIFWAAVVTGIASPQHRIPASGGNDEITEVLSPAPRSQLTRHEIEEERRWQTNCRGVGRVDPVRQERKFRSRAAKVCPSEPTSPATVQHQHAELDDPSVYDLSFQYGDSELHRSSSKRILSDCSFAAEPAYPPEKSDFATESVHFVRFLYDVMFARYGWVPVPVAGTALGVLRHGGTTPGDDDLDIFLYPPARYLEATRNLDNESSWLLMYDDFDAAARAYAAVTPGFTWYRNRDYRTERARGSRYFTTNACHFRDYHKCIDMKSRHCGAHYVSNVTTAGALRRMFFTRGQKCMPNHIYICLQPTPYLHERQGVSMYTAGGKRLLGGLCKCRFGSASLVCPQSLVGLVREWYGKQWCVPYGPVQRKTQAYMKAWND